MEDYADVYRSHDLPLFEVEGVVVPRLLIGHNPLWGGSYFSKARKKEYEQRFSSVENVVDVIRHAVEQGVAGIFISCEEFAANVIEGVRIVQERTETRMFVVSNVSDVANLERLSSIRDRAGESWCPQLAWQLRIG